MAAAIPEPTPVQLPADFDPDAPKYRAIANDLNAHLDRVQDRIDREAALEARRTGT